MAFLMSSPNEVEHIIERVPPSKAIQALCGQILTAQNNFTLLHKNLPPDFFTGKSICPECLDTWNKLET